MLKEKGFLISAVVVVAVLVIGFVIFGGKKNNVPNSDTLPSAGNSQTDANNLVNQNPAQNPNQSPTMAKAPDVEVPNASATNLPKNVAKPETVIPSGSAAIRIFEIKAAGNKFTPDTLIVNNRDTVKIKLTAVDKDYDFTQPDYGLLNYLAKQGQTRTIEFGTSASGKFTFYCETCGGPDKGPVGYLIVK